MCIHFLAHPVCVCVCVCVSESVSVKTAGLLVEWSSVSEEEFSVCAIIYCMQTFSSLAASHTLFTIIRLRFVVMRFCVSEWLDFAHFGAMVVPSGMSLLIVRLLWRNVWVRCTFRITKAHSVSSSYLTIVTARFPLLLAGHWVATVYTVRESAGSGTMWLGAKCDSAVNVTGVAVWWGIVIRLCFWILTSDFQCCHSWLLFTCLLSE